MAEQPEEAIVEEREEFMIPPTGGKPHLRPAYFLKPTVPTIEVGNLKLPSLPLSPKCYKDSLLVGFNGWLNPQMKWKKWVIQMYSKYQHIWKKAGIEESIWVSTYKIARDNDLIFGVTERWSAETNTFVFPWGEATITLEDMMILGGFSVLGEHFLLPDEAIDKGTLEIREKLEKARTELKRLRVNTHSKWLNFFMDSGNELEHEAFLSLWLSRYVFPGDELDEIGKHVFSIAARLARGTRLALAPAVLASLYRDLSLLRETMAESAAMREVIDEDAIRVTVWAPLQFVQVWAFERLFSLQMKPNSMKSGEPRVARWHSMKKIDVGNFRPLIDSAGDTVLWRPYALPLDNWSVPGFYREKAGWIFVDNQELESFARCLRQCELLGMDCIEPYQPQRVAMQFGIDQDVPELLPRSNVEAEVAWFYYSRPICPHESLYIPCRLSESDVTVGYLEWWRKTVSAPICTVPGMVRNLRSSRRSKHVLDLPKQEEAGNDSELHPCLSTGNVSMKRKMDMAEIKHEIDNNFSPYEGCPSSYLDVPPGFPPKGNPAALQVFQKQFSSEELDKAHLPVPPGICPKCNHADTIRQGPRMASQCRNKGYIREMTEPQSAAKFYGSPHLKTANEVVVLKQEPLEMPEEYNNACKIAKGRELVLSKLAPESKPQTTYHKLANEIKTEPN